MARNEQLIRQHRILQILERYRFGRTLEEVRDELVEELGLSSLHVRSVRRDLEALQAAGIDVDAHDSPRGRVWKLGPNFKGAHKITASATEVIALSLGRDLLYPLAGTPFWLGIETFWSKLREELPESVWKHFEKYRQVLLVRGMPAKSYERHHGMLKTIHRAIVEHRVVEIEYQPIGESKPRIREIEPYAVVFYQSSLYIVCGACEVADPQERLRHLKLDRFRKATALDKWFKLPEDFDLEEVIGQGAGVFSGAKAIDFRVRISARAAPWVIEDPWHPQQQIERLPDGGVVMTVKAVHEMEVIPRVLSLGADAELLEPEAARQTIARMAAATAEMYRE